MVTLSGAGQNSVLVPRAFLSSDRSSPHLAISGCEGGGAEHLSKQSRESDSFALNPETFTDNWSTLMIERSGQIQGLIIYLVWLRFMVVLSSDRTP